MDALWAYGAIIAFALILAYCGDDTPSDWNREAWKQWQDRHRW